MLLNIENKKEPTFYRLALLVLYKKWDLI